MVQRRQGEPGEVFVPVPVTDERVKLIGTAVKVEERENTFTGDMEWKMTVFIDGKEGRFKLWGTVPRALLEAIVDMRDQGTKTATLTGALIEFHAKIHATKSDNTFGFFKRPTKAVVIVAGDRGMEKR